LKLEGDILCQEETVQVLPDKEQAVETEERRLRVAEEWAGSLRLDRAEVASALSAEQQCHMPEECHAMLWNAPSVEQK